MKQLLIGFVINVLLIQAACAMNNGPTFKSPDDIPPGPIFPANPELAKLAKKHKKPCQPTFLPTDDKYAKALKTAQAFIHGWNSGWGCDYYSWAEEWMPGTLQKHIEGLKAMERDHLKRLKEDLNYAVNPNTTWGCALQVLDIMREDERIWSDIRSGKAWTDGFDYIDYALATQTNPCQCGDDVCDENWGRRIALEAAKESPNCQCDNPKCYLDQAKSYYDYVWKKIREMKGC